MKNVSDEFDRAFTQPTQESQVRVRASPHSPRYQIAVVRTSIMLVGHANPVGRRCALCLRACWPRCARPNGQRCRSRHLILACTQCHAPGWGALRAAPCARAGRAAPRAPASGATGAYRLRMPRARQSSLARVAPEPAQRPRAPPLLPARPRWRLQWLRAPAPPFSSLWRRRSSWRARRLLLLSPRERS